MKLKTILEKQKQLKGTYAGYLIGQDDEDAIITMINKMGVPNPITRKDLHMTLLYSRKEHDDYEPINELDIWGYPSNFHIFKGGDGKNILVLMIDCPDCKKRHAQLMKDLEATYDFPEYLTHLTLSYDIGDWYELDIDAINNDFIKYIPKEIHIIQEYKEPLELDWRPKN